MFQPRSLGVVVAVLLAASLSLTARPAWSREATPAPVADAPGPAVPGDAAIAALLDAGLAGSFERYLAALHPDERETDTQREHRRKFDWSRFRQQAAWYVRDRAPASFVIARRQHDAPHKIKVFLKDLRNTRRMPVPVHLVRSGDRWYVKTHSL